MAKRPTPDMIALTVRSSPAPRVTEVVLLAQLRRPDQ